MHTLSRDLSWEGSRAFAGEHMGFSVEPEVTKIRTAWQGKPDELSLCQLAAQDDPGGRKARWLAGTPLCQNFHLPRTQRLTEGFQKDFK